MTTMRLYDGIIKDTLDAVETAPCSRFPYNAANCWQDQGESGFIMQRDSGLEIGSGGAPSVNYTCVTTGGIVTSDEVCVYGEDIPVLKDGTAFARIVLLETEDLGEETDTEKAFEAIRNLDFVRYHVYPRGYMVRVSAQSDQEQIRISKQAFEAGITFEKVGDLYIKKYKEVPGVKNVRILFLTQKDLVEKLRPNAEKVRAITKTLTHILDGMPTDCGHCSMKPVCDEVDGMKELHLKKH